MTIDAMLYIYVGKFVILKCKGIKLTEYVSLSVMKIGKPHIVYNTGKRVFSRVSNVGCAHCAQRISLLAFQLNIFSVFEKMQEVGPGYCQIGNEVYKLLSPLNHYLQFIKRHVCTFSLHMNSFVLGD